MGFMLLIKNIGLFLLLISASFLSTSFAGRPCTSLNNSVKEAGAVHEASTREQHDDVSEIHERLLRANTKDYGRYDPAPTLGKPRFKLIPN